jgi:cold-inducible RNA-binding protein
MAKRLLVEGLDWGVTEGQLLRVFSPFGDLEETRVAVDWETGRSRGFGYVTFKDSADAEAAMAGLDGQKLSGKTLRVMLAPEQTTRPTYRGGDYGYVESAEQRSGTYRNADFDGSGNRKEGPSSDKKLFRSADFGYVESPREAVDAATAAPRPGAAPKAAEVGKKEASPRAGKAPQDPEESLDDEERSNRAKFGGWKEAEDNDGGRGGGGSPFG